MKLRKKKYFIVLIFILFLSIGFALLSSNLSINGLGIFKPNTWNIHFENIVDDGSEAELTVPAKIEDDGLNINFDVDLNNLGDNYYFYVDIVNDGTIDAMIDTWKLSGITPEVENFIKASVTYADGVELNNYDLLPKKKSDKLKVAVEYTDEYINSTEELPQMDGEITLTLNVNYIQADEKATVRQKRADTDSPVVRVKQNEKSLQGNNKWYKNLTLNTKLIDPSGISSAKYCATTSDICTPDNPVVLKNNTFDIRLDNSNTPWTICVETVDNEENTENYCDKNKYYVDGEDPTVSNITVTPADLSMRVELTSKDNHSGVDKYYYSKDGGSTYISSDEPNYTFSSLDANDYIVMAYVEDVAGNKSATVTSPTTVREYSWCERNGITKLGDCAIATEAHNTDITAAKKEIEDKEQPDFSKTSPTYTYKEKHSSSLTTMTTNNSTFAFGMTYTFDMLTGKYTIENPAVEDIKNINFEYGENYYSCLNSTVTQCNKLYKLDSYKKDSNGSYTISKYDYTYDVDTYDVAGIGMYATEDDLGKSYYYRGSVGGNFVEFAGMYWKIIRINGNGSVRLMYFSDNSTTQGKNAITSQYNSNYWDPTYVGFMYNDSEFSKSEITSSEGSFSNFNESISYYFGKGYTWDASAKRFKLTGTVESGDITSGVWKDKHEEIISEEYIYSCFGTSATSNCPVIMKITGYSNVNTAKVQYISRSSTSYANATKNVTKSKVLNALEAWYKSNLLEKSDSEGNHYSDYLENSIFCNDRSVSESTTGDGFNFNPTTHYGAYYRLVNKKAPSYQCPDINRDGFTLKGSSVGNELLDYPVGLITADEVAFAGGVYGQLNPYYFINYNDNAATWILSPSDFYSWSRAANGWVTSGTGSLGSAWVTSSYGVRPVISLKAGTLINGGDGTADKPYTVKLN